MTRSAEIFDHLEQVARTTGDQVFTSLLPGAKSIFGLAFSVWFLWSLVQRGVIHKDLNSAFFSKAFLVAVGVGVFLEGASYYKEWFFNPLYETATLLIQAVLQKTTLLKGGDPTIQGALTALETEVEKVIHLTRAISSDSAFYRVDHMILAFILRLAFEFLWLLYLSFAAEYIFGLMIVTALAPLIIVCLGFEKTRSMGFLACKIPIHGALTLVLGSLALSFLFQVIQSSVAQMPMNETGLAQGASQWTYTIGYDVLFIVVLLAALFLMKSAQYVASFLHINVGVGANASVAAAGSMAMGYTKKGVGFATSEAGKLVSKMRGSSS